MRSRPGGSICWRLPTAARPGAEGQGRSVGPGAGDVSGGPARFRGSSEGSSPEELRAWLRQVLLQQCRGVHAAVSGDEQAGGGTGSRDSRRWVLGGAGEALAASNLSPSGIAIEHEQAAALRRALERLPEDYRRVVVLRFEEGRSFEEIGD